MRVILWGPGQMGIGALRTLIQHPGLELAGLVVHSEAKEGRDAGDLCGLPATGIIATRDIDAALALDADAVAYYASGDYRYREAVDDIARCPPRREERGDHVDRALLPPARRRARRAGDARSTRARTAARPCSTAASSRAGSTTWCRSCSARRARASTRSRCRRSSTTRRSRSPTSCTTSWASLIHPTTSRPLQEPGRLNSLWSPVVWGLAAAHGLELDSVEDTLEKWIAPESYETASGPLPAGTTGAMWFRLVGMKDGEERIVLEHITRMGEHSAPDWPRHPSPLGGYRVILEGMPTYTVDIEMHGRGSNMRGLSFATVHATAQRGAGGGRGRARHRRRRTTCRWSPAS